MEGKFVEIDETGRLLKEQEIRDYSGFVGDKKNVRIGTLHRWVKNQVGEYEPARSKIIIGTREIPLGFDNHDDGLVSIE